MTTRVGVESAVRSLLESAVDYAGMFPPAKLTLTEAASQYASAHAGMHSWLLGRFLLPLARLEDFGDVVEASLPARGSSVWPVGVIATDDRLGQLDAIQRFNERWTGSLSVEAVEVAPLSRSRVGEVAGQVPEGVDVYFEVRPDEDVGTYLEVVAAAGAGAKIRTGGVTADAFPSTSTLAEFIASCASARVPFKATAGLHHALRGPHPLTPALDNTTTMHGFLNLSVAAALVHVEQADLSEVRAALDETSTDAFRFRSGRLTWRDRTLAAANLIETRQRSFNSFGSCSFDEPVADLEALGML